MEANSDILKETQSLNLVSAKTVTEPVEVRLGSTWLTNRRLPGWLNLVLMQPNVIQSDRLNHRVKTKFGAAGRQSLGVRIRSSQAKKLKIAGTVKQRFASRVR